MRLKDLGLVGNCHFSALLDAEQGGRLLVGPADGKSGTQQYVENSNVLETSFRTDSGAFRVLGFAPRLAGG